MKKLYISAALVSALAALPATAQDIYKIEQLSSTDLNGDARYIGMGGAMSALGANLSAMSTNPASSALYRKSDFSATASLLNQSNRADNLSNSSVNNTKASLDQMGFVYSLYLDGGNLRFVNMGFNYKKSKNFSTNGLLHMVPMPTGNNLSQSLLMRQLAQTGNGWLDLGNSGGRASTSPYANLGYEVFMIDPVRDQNKRVTDYKHSQADAYHQSRQNEGGIQAYDFNLAFNFNDRFYFGANLGVYSVNYESWGNYEEQNLREDGSYFTSASGERKTFIMKHYEQIMGSGVDAKFGAIVRPFAESNFRLGLSVTTPTLYSLETNNRLHMSSPYGHTDTKTNTYYEYTENQISVSNDYRIVAPWKVNFSLGTTIGRRVALGVEYEIVDHTTAQARVVDDNYEAFEWSTGRQDDALQNEIDTHLRDIHTLRLGMEVLATPNFSVRAGYNFVSSPFAKNAYLNMLVNGQSRRYSTAPDYINYGNTHRATFGVGYHTGGFYLDAAFLYQLQSADMYAFHYNRAPHATANELPAQHLNLRRSTFTLTAGFRF
ncbi:OmpP1/FadL family transporter [Alloprevotella sp. oral taxon 473]|uniref:OmpP1/FadL family transporter n=1 Tax=Alloprevotella sp. oral taxon 473 TaxID=712469 RepID=UPI0002A279DC|nr:hypothetical protein [Alloprevotella sp. oral taxon 473]EKX89101.1 hypothetical protein HMPREF9999_01630 [Alloprevotella sp. oral taxon 473 str. F0040]